ncbi:MAG TPA: NAD(P)/FAD-dependent oxidoreductase [Propionicimonas sp.]|nr:NAD(P)/FAD-dependent oxidoreductase [Actinotalea sp.]HRA75474.1 NAD(P)/FAD-dependent oxidoreductase [Propionicimonas sp.]
MTDTEVLIVGGGPVGLAAAIHARLAGYDVVVVEPRTAPVDKACGEGLLPGALAAVRALGVDPPGHRLAGIAYLDDRRRAEHRFAGEPGRGVRRTTLHAALAARAAELGAVHLTARVQDVRWDRDGAVAAGVSARWLLGCDGLHSTVRRAAGLEPPGPTTHGVRRRYGLRRHVRIAAWTDLVEVHWGRRAEAYVTPVGQDLVGVALLGPPGAGFDELLDEVPALRDRLGDAERGPVRGAGPLRQRSVRRTAGPVRLVGDASGYVDALTGEGLRVGFAQAAAAVATLGDDAAYERAWRSVTRDYRWLTTGLVAWATSPARGAVVPLARRVPPVFAAAVERLAR